MKSNRQRAVKRKLDSASNTNKAFGGSPRARQRYAKKCAKQQSSSNHNNQTPDLPKLSEIDTSPEALVIGNYYAFPHGGRTSRKQVATPPTFQTSIRTDGLPYTLHPSPRQDLQSDLQYDTADDGDTPMIYNNFYLTGKYSMDTHNKQSYLVYVTITSDPTVPLIERCRQLLEHQLSALGKQGYDAGPGGLLEASIDIISLSDYADYAPLDDNIFTSSSSHIVHPRLISLPLAYKVTLPSVCPAALGLGLLASRQAEVIKPVRHVNNDVDLPNDIQSYVKSQSLTVVRTSVEAKGAKLETKKLVPTDQPCKITCEAFRDLSPNECHRLFQQKLLINYHIRTSDAEHSAEASRATRLEESPAQVQHLLQIANATQPASKWTKASNMPTTCEFKAVEDRYNPILLQGQRLKLPLRSHLSSTDTDIFTIAPPKAGLNSPKAMERHNKTSILVQCDQPLPLLLARRKKQTLDEDSYLQQALVYAYSTAISNLDLGNSPLFEIDATEDGIAEALVLKIGPDGAIVHSHHSDQGTQPFNCVVTLENVVSYAILATHTKLIEVELPTKISTGNGEQPQLVSLRIQAHHDSLLGGKYIPYTVGEAARAAFSDLDPLQLAEDKSRYKGERLTRLQWAKRLLGSDFIKQTDKAIADKRAQQHPGRGAPPPGARPAAGASRDTTPSRGRGGYGGGGSWHKSAANTPAKQADTGRGVTDPPAEDSTGLRRTPEAGASSEERTPAAPAAAAHVETASGQGATPSYPLPPAPASSVPANGAATEDGLPMDTDGAAQSPNLPSEPAKQVSVTQGTHAPLPSEAEDAKEINDDISMGDLIDEDADITAEGSEHSSPAANEKEQTIHNLQKQLTELSEEEAILRVTIEEAETSIQQLREQVQTAEQNSSSNFAELNAQLQTSIGNINVLKQDHDACESECERVAASLAEHQEPAVDADNLSSPRQASKTKAPFQSPDSHGKRNPPKQNKT